MSYELVQETRRREAEAFKALRAEHLASWVGDFNRELRSIDRYLKLVWAPDPLPVDAVGSGVRPGRWHVMRHNPGAPTSFLCIEDEDGNYVEPTSQVFEQLRAMDWWNPEVNRERKRVQRELELAKERREAEELKAMDDEVMERWLARTRTQISMNSSVPWSQNAMGRRGARQ